MHPRSSPRFPLHSSRGTGDTQRQQHKQTATAGLQAHLGGSGRKERAPHPLPMHGSKCLRCVAMQNEPCIHAHLHPRAVAPVAGRGCRGPLTHCPLGTTPGRWDVGGVQLPSAASLEGLGAVATWGVVQQIPPLLMPHGLAPLLLEAALPWAAAAHVLEWLSEGLTCRNAKTTLTAGLLPQHFGSSCYEECHQQASDWIRGSSESCTNS
jgi:hypothetical protein